MIRSTQLIYQAALASGHAPYPAGPVPDDHCWICAGPTNGQGALVSDVISHTFTDTDFVRWAGQSICEACMFCLKHKPLRTRSTLATLDGYRQPMRQEWRDILLNPPGPPWVGAIAISGKKHVSFKAQVNLTNHAPVVSVEMMPVRYSVHQLAADLAVIEELLQSFTRREVETGSYSQHRIKQFGLLRLADLEQQVVEMRRRRRQFDLALLIARGPDKEQPAEVEPRGGGDFDDQPVSPAEFDDQPVSPAEFADLPLFGRRG